MSTQPMIEKNVIEVAKVKKWVSDFLSSEIAKQLSPRDRQWIIRYFTPVLDIFKEEAYTLGTQDAIEKVEEKIKKSEKIAIYGFDNSWQIENANGYNEARQDVLTLLTSLKTSLTEQEK